MDLHAETKTTARLDAAIDRALEERRVVGAVVLIAREGRVVYRRAAGFANRERGAAMREDAIFRLASVTKPFVTAAALRFVQEGKIALDDPVTRFLPAFRPALSDGETPAITVRQLLTHTAGLSYGFLQPPDGSYHRAGVSDGVDQPGLGMAEELERIVRAGLAYRPGARWAYSVAIDVLGAVLEAAAGASLAQVMAQTILRPLDLTDTGFSLPPGGAQRLVAQYADGTPAPERIPDSGKRVRFPENLPFYAGVAGVNLVPARIFDQSSFPSGGGGMAGTAGDVLRFLEAIRAGGGPILDRDSVRAMMTVQTGDFPIPNRGPGWGFGYGGAVLVDPTAAQSPQSPGTFGWGGVWGHSWFIDPVKHFTVVSLTNTALEGMMGRFTRDIRDAVYADLA